MLAILEARQAGLLQRRHWLRNLVAGTIVGVVALPLAMAFAIASGAKPEQGIYTAIIAGLLVSLCGGSRLQIAGPTGAFVVVLSGITAEYGIVGLQLATLMAGLMLLLLGLARLGSVIKFIPDPVITGFTAGIAVIIFVGQWQDFFGLPRVAGEHFHDKLLQLLHLLSQLHVTTTLLALGSLLLVIVTPRLPLLRKVPGPLVALVAATTLQLLFQFDGVATIGSAFGGIPRGLPGFAVPDLSWGLLRDLVGPAFAIAMLGAIESLLSAVVADGMAGTRHDSNQELIGQGLANLVAPLFGGFAATGAIARTATNVRNGGNSPLAGVIHALTLLLILLLLAPLASHIPLAVLAAILFVVAWNMSEAQHFIKMLRGAPRSDVAVLLLTFGLTVFADLVVAVNIGVIVSTLLVVRRMASSVEVHSSTGAELPEALGSVPPGVQIFTVDGPFFFGSVEKVERALLATHTDPRLLIIHLQRVPFIDVTGLQALEEAILDLQRRGVGVWLAGANTQVRGKLAKAGVLDLVGSDASHADLPGALAAARRLLGDGATPA